MQSKSSQDISNPTFLEIGAGSNYTQTNSWAPRLRHGYLTYDNSDWGIHFLAGQSWSMRPRTRWK